MRNMAVLLVALWACSPAPEKGADENGEGSTPVQEIDPILSVLGAPTEMGALATAALARAPAWLRDDLALKLLQLKGAKQDRVASLLVDLTDDRLVDEVAFTIAHLSVEVFKDPEFEAELVVENAEWVYKVDPDLAYVQIVEYGDPASDDDFWSTTSYRTTVDGMEVELELERDLYYWYVVHPRVEDERPYYIDGWAACLDSDMECPKTSDEGMFWRQFFWEGAATTCPEGNHCPVLSDAFGDTELLWNEGGGGDAAGAVRSIVDFLHSSDEEAGRWMNFGAEGERSIQPNRIYGLGRGNCGEWSDMTTSLSRTALIPAINVTPSSWDHTWNGFYNGRWVAWEPVNVWVDHAFGVDFAAYATRGDATTFHQTGDYNDQVFQMEVEVVDKKGIPVDGAMVAIFSPYDDQWWSAGERATDGGGIASFELVADNDYTFLVTHPLGTYPEEDNTVTSGSSGVAVGEVDRITVELAGKKMPKTLAFTLVDAVGEATLSLELTDIDGRVMGTSWRYEDSFALPDAPPVVDTFVVDQANYDLFLSGVDFEAVAGDVGEVGFDAATTWYAVVRNGLASSSAAIGTLTVAVDGGALTEGASEVLRYRLLPDTHVAVRVGG